MPNKVKYNPTGNEPGAIFKGNWAIDTSPPNTGGGPSSVTGFYNGADAPEGGYVIYEEGVVRTIADDTELINYTNSKSGETEITTVAEALDWVAGQPNSIVTDKEFENIVTDGLIVNLDAGSVSSYPKSGTSWYDLSGNELHATLYNGASYDSGNQGTIVFDGTNDFARISASPITAINVFTFELWVNRTGIATFTGPYDRIFQKDGGYSGYPAWGFHLGEGTPASPSFRSAYSSAISDYNNTIGFTEDAAMEFGEWHYYAASLDASLNLKLYHNGTLDNDGVLNEVPMSTENTISIAIGDDREFYGKIPIVRVYNRSLSAAEVLQNFNAQKSRFGL